MASITLQQLMAGIRQEESGGNYSVVNSIGAVGAYQVMKANVPSWTKRALGRAMTWQEFRDSPSAQDQVAAYMLGGYLKRYGAAGAAAMWFSGQPNPNSGASDGNTSVQNYVKNVLSLATGSSNVDISDFSTGTGTSTTTSKLDAGTLASQYGLASATINANKELKSLFGKAVAGQWTADRFTAALKNTNWWKTTSDSARQFFMLKTSDPATFAAKWQQDALHVNDLAVKLGVANMLGGGTSFSGKAMDNTLRVATLHVLQDGWSDDQLSDWLGSFVKVNNGIMAGAAGENWDQLHQYAYSQGMSYHWQQYYQWARGIASGTTTLEAAQSAIRNQAAARYSAWADQIKAGQSVMDLANPYINAVSQVLEIPQTELGLSNKYVQQAMTNKVQQPLWQFENTLRNDPTWTKTDNARESLMGVAHKVLQDFGVSF